MYRSFAVALLTFSLMTFAAARADTFVPTGGQYVGGHVFDPAKNPYAVAPGKNIADEMRQQFEARRQAFKNAQTPQNQSIVKPQPKLVKPPFDEKKERCLTGNFSDCY